MRVTKIVTPFHKNIYQNNADKFSDNMQDYPQYDDMNAYKNSSINFGSAGFVKIKKVDIDFEKAKLIKYLDEILKNNDLETSHIEKMVNILQSAVDITKNKSISIESAIKKVSNLQKKLKVVQNDLDVLGSRKDDKIDFLLINKFKTAVLGDDFNLKKVFIQHYSDLKNITTIEKLKEIYPKIKIPENPADVVAKKIESALTRDFYEDFFDIVEDSSSGAEDMFIFSDKKIRSIIKEHAQIYKTDPGTIYKKIAIKTHEYIVDRYKKLLDGDSFSSIPMFRKNNKRVISENDIKLLSVDYDRYVLDVVQKHYLEGKKLNEIKYNEDKITISPHSLHEPEYKFEKIPEKIKGIINTGQMLQNAQRDYKHFDVTRLRERLNFYANSELGNNEEILERIIAFDSCKFIKEEMSLFVKFLKELDMAYDGKKSIEDVLKTIYKNDLRPKATERLTELEMQKAAEQYKLEMKKAAELNDLKYRFDTALNFFYSYDMSLAANQCAKYRPENLDENSLKKANEFIAKAGEYIKQSEEKTFNKAKIEREIIRWDTYNHYKTDKEHSVIFQKASAYAMDENGNTDINKAGKYIINSQLVESYPDSIEFAQNPEVFAKILESVSNKDEAVKYLCKYDEYNDMNNDDKHYISKFAQLFDIKDKVEKMLYKHIVESEYLTSDTTILTNVYDGDFVSATISAKAKQQIYDKYKFPLCIEYMTCFEEALSKLAAKRGASGIKKTFKTRTHDYSQELKIIGHDDRLFSSKEDYVFDIFSGKGIH